MAYLVPDDLAPFADIEPLKAAALIEDALAHAIALAPCLANEGDLSPEQVALVRAVMREAVLRRDEAGTGALTHTVAGPFSETTDTRQRRGNPYNDYEMNQLHSVCEAVAGRTAGKAYAVDTLPPGSVALLPWDT